MIVTFCLLWFLYSLLNGIFLKGWVMKYIFAILILSAALFSACSSEEKVINPVSTSEKILVATDELQPKLKVLELPELKELSSDLMKNDFELDITTPIEYIADFGGHYYILVPGDFKIFVVRKIDMSLITTIDFTADQYQPNGIVFVENDADAYIIHKNSVYATLLDLTNFVAAKNITVGNPPHSIAISGNQIYVTNYPDNTVSVIDIRDRKVVAVINTEPKPVFVKMTADGKTAVCLTVGLGKSEIPEVKTPAFLQYIDIATRVIFKSHELGFAQILSTEQIPQGLAVTQKDWGFVSTQDNLLRFDLRLRDRINLVIKRNFYFISNDVKNNRLMLLRTNGDGTEIMFADDKSGEIKELYTLPYKIKFVHPY